MKMRLLVVGFSQRIVDALATQETGVKVLRDISTALDFAVNPIAMSATSRPIDMHPNDDWRGKGKRKKRFK